MANRPRGFGMTAELQRKKDSKYDANLEAEARQWIEAVLGLSAGSIGSGKDEFHASLKDGVTLCNLINALSPGSVKKINESKMAFKQMENVGNFLSACENYGCSKADLFQTVDLYENQNMPQVINAIFALGRKSQSKGFNGPSLGPAEASENKREFTEEQLRAGDGVIGLQAGTNKGASQSGQNFGKSRSILD